MIENHKIILIAAVDKNWAIGKDNQLLYHIPTDMKFFKEKTKNNIVLYGRKTLQSFPNSEPLPYRDNIVLTTSDISPQNNLLVAHSVEDTIEIIKSFNDNRDVFICGGSSIYSQYVDMCDYAFITKIDAETPDATNFMVNLDKKEKWEEILRMEPIFDGKSKLNIIFATYKNCLL